MKRALVVLLALAGCEGPRGPCPGPAEYTSHAYVAAPVDGGTPSSTPTRLQADASGMTVTYVVDGHTIVARYRIVEQP